ncbi:hypothetical protein KY325_01445 [Candidatus Woesearchaeota archaeon]|nr:hypothetical protein [Candidatus Woesearchaeota archaeon]MBW3017803.1 hypothetical protein [Candidatus Woesearchaeota archaeon]
MVTIGIPSAGYGQSYGLLWKTFFEELGFDVVFSPETTKQIVDNGVKNSDTDLCFAIKIYVGHVLELKDKVDYIFIPSMSGGRQFQCSYHMALPYLIKNMFPGLKILAAKIGTDNPQMRAGLFEMMKKKFKTSEKKMQAAIQAAWNEDSKNESKKGFRHGEKWKKAKYRIALVGADYVTNDKFCLMNIPEYLEKENALLVDMNYPRRRSPIDRKTAGFEIRWEVEQDLVDRFIDAVDWKDIDGIIYIMPFSCGPCFLFQEQVINENSEKPVLVLNVDESQNETRIKTRIEAFVDVVKGRKK